MVLKKDTVKKIILIGWSLFVFWGFLLTAVFFAMKYGFTLAPSRVDEQSPYFTRLQNDKDISGAIAGVGVVGARGIYTGKDFANVAAMEEWFVVKEGIRKDATVIHQVSQETGVSERLLITPLVVEQLRMMTSEREVFKRYFQPFAVLGTQTQFSLGIYGIKEGTARQIEENLKNPVSSRYLGPAYEHMLDYGVTGLDLTVDDDTLEPVKKNTDDANDAFTSSNSSVSQETIAPNVKTLTGSDADRIRRLTDEKNRYYAYLYAALYLKEIMTEWYNAGYDIADRPEILMTLYNLGFGKSVPKDNPQTGGAVITLNGTDYTFGSLAFYFYYSGELSEMSG